MGLVRIVIFLAILIEKYIFCSSDFTLTTSSTEATAGVNFSIICTTSQTVLRFTKDGFAFCFVGKKNNVCTFDRRCPTDYRYSCNTVLNTYTITLPGSFVSNSLQGSKWMCGNFKEPYNYSNEVKFIVNVPLESIIISPDTTPVEIEKNAVKRFMCSANSRPPTIIQWKKDIPEQNSQVLTPQEDQVNGINVISYLNYTGNIVDEGAEIFCSGIYNGTSKISTKLTLRIIYAPDTVPIIQQIPNKNVSTGDNVILTCTVFGGNPLPVLSWNCSGDKMDNTVGNKSSYSVAFIVNKNDNNKICTCSVLSHPVTSYRPTAHHVLVVFYPPDNDPSIQQTPNTDIFAGFNVTLTCIVSGGNPLAALAWNCSGTSSGITNDKTVSNSITFTVDKMYNKRICSCSATHLFSSYNRSVEHTLTVYYAPETLPIIKRMPNRNLNDGEYVTLTCIVSGGNPLTTLSWNCTGNMTNNTTINTASYSVAFTVNKTYNDMVCICSASHFVQSYRPKVSLRLVVYFGPGKPVFRAEPLLPWFEGNSSSLFCEYDEGNPKASIRWTRGNKIVDARTDRSILEFDRLTSSDDALKITCTVYNPYSENISSIIYLDVHYLPNVMVEKNHIITNESKSISLSCNASGNPLPFVGWTMVRKGIDIPTSYESILNIKNINRTDSGIYTCEARSNSTRYGILVSTKDTEVVVNFAPDVTVTKNVLNITDNIDLILTCNATGKPPTYAYRWKHTFKGQSIRVFNSNINTNTLVLKYISYQDIGKYECFVNNGIEDRHGILIQNNSIIVEVQFKPTFVVYDNVTTGKNGGNVSMFADFISFPDIVKPVTWRNSTGNSVLVNSSNTFMTLKRKIVHTKIYNISVSFDRHGYTSSLYFPNFDENQEGFYNLEVGNTIGKNNLTMRLVFSDHPEPPSLFTGSVSGSTLVTLTWKEGFNGGHDQTFIITYWAINSVYKKSFNVSERSDKKYEVDIFDLTPSTSYMFDIIARNEEGFSDSENNTIMLSTKDIPDTSSSVSGPVAGAVGGSVLAGLFVVGIIVFRRKRLASRKKTDRKKLTFTSREEDEDGLKDNELYVSAGEHFTDNSAPTGDVYAVIKKPNDKYSKEKLIQETGLYAEVKKKKDESNTDKITTKARKKQTGNNTIKGKLKNENKRDEDVYENVTEQNITNKPKNKDGLVYADLVFKEDGKRKFIIRGIENKTDYADIDLELKADPLPSDESDDENEKATDNVEKNKEK